MKLKLTKNEIFTVTFLVVTVISIIELFHGVNPNFYFHQDTIDSFMDLFNSVIEHYHSKSEFRFGIYPPLAEIPYKLFSLLVPSDIPFSIGTREQAFALRSTLAGNVMLMLHIVPFFVVFVILLMYSIDGSFFRKVFYTILIASSGIVFWALERGNIIIYAFLFAFLFFVLYKNENRYIRWLSYICLAISVGLKLYPAVFAIVLLRDKRYKAIFFFIACVLIVYILLLLSGKGSLSSIVKSFENMLRWSNKHEEGMGLNCSVKNFFLLINIFFRKCLRGAISIQYTNQVFYVIQILTLFFGIFSFFFSEEKWKKVFSLTVLCIYIPSVSYMYTLIFLIVPLVFFINEKKQSGIFDFFYAMIFAIVIVFFIIPVKTNAEVYFVTGNFALQQTVLMLMFLMVVGQAIIRCCCKFSKNRLNSTL